MLSANENTSFGADCLIAAINVPNDVKCQAIERVVKEFYGINWDRKETIKLNKLEDYKNFILTYFLYVDVPTDIIKVLTKRQTALLEFFMFSAISEKHNGFFISYTGPYISLAEWQNRICNAVSKDIAFLLLENNWLEDIFKNEDIVNEFSNLLKINYEQFKDGSATYIHEYSDDFQKMINHIVKFLYITRDINIDTVFKPLTSAGKWLEDNWQSIEESYAEFDKRILLPLFNENDNIAQNFYCSIIFVCMVFIAEIGLPKLQVIDNQ